ncbi:hypothetical protein ColKHC_05920 [Colletotrichum higginsianum]|nr:hypothetical protein ColKHC_05920 [Colletotrichum higginsianum]
MTSPPLPYYIWVIWVLLLPRELLHGAIVTRIIMEVVLIVLRAITLVARIRFVVFLMREMRYSFSDAMIFAEWDYYTEPPPPPRRRKRSVLYWWGIWKDDHAFWPEIKEEEEAERMKRRREIRW